MRNISLVLLLLGLLTEVSWGQAPSGSPMIPSGGSSSSGGSGTVTSVSVVTANGVSGSVATATTTPAITVTLGAITPSTVAIGAGSAITSSGPGGVLGSNAFNSTAFAPLASPTFTGTVTMPDSATWTSSGVAALTALGLTNTAAVTWAGRGILTSPAAGTLQHGAADVNGAPVAQIIINQNALAGSATNTASPNTTYVASLGTGTGTNGDFIFQTGVKTTTGTVQATATTVMTLKGETKVAAFAGSITVASGGNITMTAGSVNIAGGGACFCFSTEGGIFFSSDGVIRLSNNAFNSFGRLQFGGTTSSFAAIKSGASTTIAMRLADDSADAPLTASAVTFSGTLTNTGIGSDATHTDTTVCQDTTTHLYLAGSGTAGICLGNVSSIRFKDAWTPLSDGLSVVMALNPGTWRYRPGVADGGERLQVGFLAEEYGRVLPDWTRRDDQDRPNGVDLLAVLPQAVRAIQQLDMKKVDRDELVVLRAEVEKLRRSIVR